MLVLCIASMIYNIIMKILYDSAKKHKSFNHPNKLTYLYLIYLRITFAFVYNRIIKSTQPKGKHFRFLTYQFVIYDLEFQFVLVEYNIL